MWAPLLLLSLFPVSLLCQEDELKLVVVLYRHGDRTPITPYPNDPYKDPSEWPAEFGQLTPRGKQMQYKLGQYLRERYGNLLGTEYSSDTIYVRSTDVDRTLMSAGSNLAGLYPPQGQQVWNPDLKWQPIPVHTVPLEEDRLLSSHAKCPKFTRLVEEVMESEEMRKIDEENKEMYEYISENSGSNITNIVDIDYIFDTLFIEDIYNKTLPEWTKKVFPDKMRPLRDLSFTITTWTEQLKRLRSGPILDNLLELSREEKEKKMIMYSGHDTTLSSLLNALDMFDPPLAPPYASLVMMEVLESPSGERFMQWFYRNDTTREPYPLVLSGCEAKCPVEKFASLTEHLRPGEGWEGECELNYDSTANVVTLVSIFICVLLVLILVGAVIVSFVRKGSSEAHTYQHLNQEAA